MNVHSDTTRPTDEAIINAIRDIEAPIADLATMATILTDLLDYNLVEFDMATGQRRSYPKEGRNLTVILTAGQVDQLSFAWHDISDRASRLKRAYLAALKGKEVAA